MIAIQTKYIGPTNTRGSRIKAWTSSGFSVTISYPHELSHELCHFEAVKSLVEKHKLDWDLADMRFGGTERGYVFCFAAAIVEPPKPEYQPKTGAKCGCRPGNARENCQNCEGTGEVIDFAKIRNR